MSADIKIFTDEIEGQALNQCYQIAKSPVFTQARIRIMPDVHAGKGCVIGFTAQGMTKLIPNLVGVDIGCGMLTAKLEATDLDLEKLDQAIKRTVPAGFAVHEAEQREAERFLDALKCKDKIKKQSHLLCSLGTLGGGNHFIEVDRAEDGSLYLVIHTGSRNLGLQVANIYQDLAVKHCSGTDQEAIHALIRELKEQGKEQEIQSRLKALKESRPKVPEELAWCSERDSRDYLHDAWIAAQFAKENREQILRQIMDAMDLSVAFSFHTIHNYVDLTKPETPVIRKGAISAEKEEWLLIPLNMRDGCILGQGKGNPDWNCSAPHGAGRLMSRSKAKETISLEDFQEAMKGIYSTSICTATLDESPFAYKDASSIVEKIGDTVEIRQILKPIYNFKAH